MNTAASPEGAGYRSIIQILNLYCLYKILFLAWNLQSLFQFAASKDMDFITFFTSFYQIFVTPFLVVTLLIANISRGAGAHAVRLVILSIWFAYRLFYLPNILEHGDVTSIALAIFDLGCLALFFCLLLRPRRSPNVKPV